MKIVHVTAFLNPEFGGPTKACIGMAQAIALRGHSVTIHTTDIGVREEIRKTGPSVEKNGVRIHYHHAVGPKRWPWSPALSAALDNSIRDADIVHSHSLYLPHTRAVWRSCRRFDVPYIVRPHGTLDPYLLKRHRIRKVLAGLIFHDRVLKDAAVFHFTADEERVLAGRYISPLNGFVVPNGLEPGDYHNLPAEGKFRARFPEVGDKKIILFLGRINFKKGLDILVKAFGNIARQRADVCLVIAGPDGGERTRTLKWLRREGVLDRTVFTGMLTGEDKLAAFRDGDVFVLPSYSENFGIAIIESLACGLPVVISDKVNIWREIKEADAGRVTSLDPEQVAESILEILANPELAERMATAGKALVQKKFAWKIIAADLETAYIQLLEENQVRASRMF